MVHGWLTRSGWYSLFLLTGNGKRYPLLTLAGKGYPLPTGRERVWLFRYCCSTSTISQSSATSGSLATGTGGVVGLAAEGVDGGVKLVTQGHLLALGEGMVLTSLMLEAGHCPRGKCAIKSGCTDDVDMYVCR